MREHDHLVERFEDGTLESLDHHDHVALAWKIIQRDGIHGALATFPLALKRFASARGAHELYSETITWLYLLLINERRSQLTPDHDWAIFEEHNPDLFDNHIALLERFYSQERLESPSSKTCFLLPDRAQPRVDPQLQDRP